MHILGKFSPEILATKEKLNTKFTIGTEIWWIDLFVDSFP
jgi:hypothetical protein